MLVFRFCVLWISVLLTYVFASPIVNRNDRISPFLSRNTETPSAEMLEKRLRGTLSLDWKREELLEKRLRGTLSLDWKRDMEELEKRLRGTLELDWRRDVPGFVENL